MPRFLSGALLAVACAAPVAAADLARDYEPDNDPFLVIRGHDTARTVMRFANTPYAALLATDMGQAMLNEMVEEPAREFGQGNIDAGKAIILGLHEFSWSLRMEPHHSRPEPDEPSFQLGIRGPGVPGLTAAFVNATNPTPAAMPAGAPFEAVYQEHEMQVSHMGELLFFQYHDDFPDRHPEIALPMLASSAPTPLDAEADAEAMFTMAPISAMVAGFAGHPDNQGGEFQMIVAPLMANLADLEVTASVALTTNGMRESISVTHAGLPPMAPTDASNLAGLPAETVAAFSVRITPDLLNAWQSYVPAELIGMAMGEVNAGLGEMGLGDYDTAVAGMDGDAVFAVLSDDLAAPGVYARMVMPEHIGVFAVAMVGSEMGLVEVDTNHVQGIVDNHPVELAYRNGALEFTNWPAGLAHFDGANGFLERPGLAERLAEVGDGAWAVGLSDSTASLTAIANLLDHTVPEDMAGPMGQVMRTVAMVAGVGSIAITPTDGGVTINSEGLLTGVSGSLAGLMGFQWFQYQMMMREWEAQEAAP